MEPWERKAHELVGRYARQAWLANKKRGGYSLPEIASALVAALGLKDRGESEREVKRLFEIERVGAWSLI